jgi:hypothetical protein
MPKGLIYLGVGTLILSIIGLYNGYPLVYSDTGTYIESGFEKYIPFDRPITYGLFVSLSSLGHSVWVVITIQNLITAFVVYETLKLFFKGKEYFSQVYYSVLLFLVIATGIGWYTNQIMPDMFAPLLILVLYNIMLGDNKPIYTKIILYVILIFSLVAHFSHLLIGTSLIAIAILLRLILKNSLRHISLRRLYLIGVLILVSWTIIPSVNYWLERQFILSKGSHIFLMAHLNDTGILQKFLNENCSSPEFQHLKLCSYKDSLPPDLASFMWTDDIIQKTGGWINSEDEYKTIINETLKRPKYLLLNIYRSLTYGFIQLTKNDIGQGLTAYKEGSPPYRFLELWFPYELNNYKNSKQNKWDGIGLEFDFLNTISNMLLVLCLFLCIVIFTGKLQFEVSKNSLQLLVFVLIAIVLNSFITAGLNSPGDRFQARVVWLLPMAIIIFLIDNSRLIKDRIVTKKTP